MKRGDNHRVEVNLPCEFRLIQNKIVMPKRISAIIRDIGYHGLMMELDCPLKVFDDIRLDFDIPLVDFKVTDIDAKVVQPRVAAGRNFYGVEFTSLSPDANMKIHFFVQMLVTAEQELNFPSA